MAKKPRLGRNINAILGGATRNRREPAAANAPTVVASAGDSAAVDSVSGGTSIDSGSHLRAVTLDDAISPAPDTETVSVARQPPIDDVAEERAHEEAYQATDSAVTKADSTDIVKTGDSTNLSGRLRMIGTDLIHRGAYQPRRHFDKELLQELADSLKAQGMIQPILVRPDDAGKYELIAGERRWRAAQLAGFDEVPAIVRDMEDQSVAAVALIENIQRKDLNPLEEAAAFERLCDEFGMTHKAVAESVGRSRAAVSNLMRLLELHDDVKIMIDKSELEMGHARALLGAPIGEQSSLALRAVKQGLTVRAVEKIVRDLRAGKPAVAPPVVEKQDPDIARLSRKLGDMLGAPVRIKHRSNGGGRLEVDYGSVAELEGILAHIK
ncbi:MAG: ParB/RepB/Spo0J family partition protein [Granulosicoccus sp.]